MASQESPDYPNYINEGPVVGKDFMNVVQVIRDIQLAKDQEMELALQKIVSVALESHFDTLNIGFGD